MNKKNILVICSNVNSKGKHDATGAFIPEARAFQLLHGIPVNNMCMVDCVKQSPEKRRAQVLSAIAAVGRNEPIEAVAFFGHGWPRGIQCGFSRKHIPELVDRLKHFASESLKIVLYACLTAENDERDMNVKRIGPATEGGFADCLAAQLGAAGFGYWVDAHKTSGHATWNPYVIRFQCKTSKPRAAWLVEPGSQFWGKWITAMRGTNLRFEFSFWSEFNVKALL